MRLDSVLKKSRTGPDISRPKKSRHVLMDWMSVKLPDNFQIREHSRPCLFHINLFNRGLLCLTNISVLLVEENRLPGEIHRPTASH